MGRKFVCKRCNNNFILSQDNQYIEKSSTVELMHFDCTHCNRTASVKKQNNLFGKKLLCKGCSNYFILSQSNLQTPQEPMEMHPLSPREKAFIEGLKSFLDKPAPGKTKNFDRYIIRKELGRGVMGKVCEAYDPKLDRVVAIKLLLGGANAQEKEEKRFLREAKATEKLNHPNIVKVYDVGHADNQYFFTMEVIRGITFKKFLKGNVHKNDLLKILAKITSAMGYAHSQGIIHRDLKPANIMIEGLEPKVLDFGLVKVMEESHALTSTGTILGTLTYMAPEQAKGLKIDSRIDIYALGMMLYEILTGQVPFQGQTTLGLICKIVREAPMPPNELNPNISPGLSNICLKAIAKDKKLYLSMMLLLLFAILPKGWQSCIKEI